jgi:hypothetical protein
MRNIPMHWSVMDIEIYQPEGDVVISIGKSNYSFRIWLWHRKKMLEDVGSPFTSLQ